MLIGVSGAWGSRLLALAPLQPFFVAAAVISFGFAFHRLYLKREACAPGEACAAPGVRRRQRVIFWVLAVTATALMSFPLYAALFYGWCGWLSRNPQRVWHLSSVWANLVWANLV